MAGRQTKLPFVDLHVDGESAYVLENRLTVVPRAESRVRRREVASFFDREGFAVKFDEVRVATVEGMKIVAVVLQWVYEFLVDKH